jgi:membrane-associated phospholipid phosphatase
MLLTRLVQSNKILFSILAVIIVFGFIGILLFDSVEPLIFFNPIREGQWVIFFSLATLFGEPVSFLVSFIVLLFFKYRYAIMIPICGICTLFLSALMKIGFSHPRPMLVMKEQQLLEKIRSIENLVIYEGYTSFPSGHTFAAFSLFTLIALMIPEKKITPIFCIMIASLVGVSRVYLLHHFMHDVVFGMIIGVFLAILLYFFQHYLLHNRIKLDQNIYYVWKARLKKVRN